MQLGLAYGFSMGGDEPIGVGGGCIHDLEFLYDYDQSNHYWNTYNVVRSISIQIYLLYLFVRFR